MTAYGWIIYNGNLPGNKFLDFAEMLQQSAEKHNSKAIIIKNNDLLVSLGHHQLEVITNQKLPDYVVFADKDIYLAKQLELLRIPVFNRAHVIETSDDKIATYQVLAKHNLPIPRTIIAPKVFYNREEKYLPDLDQIVDQLGLPLIVKEAFGSFGEQVYLISTMNELRSKVQELYGKPFLFQEFISTSKGMDLRLQVVGDKVVAAMKRSAKNDFRANVTAGGITEAYEPSVKAKEIAIAASQAIGADFCGVDLLFGENDEYVICEVNSNAHIRNLLDCTGINAADSIMEYILNKVRN